MLRNEPIIKYRKSNHWDKSNHIRDTRFSSRGSHAYQHASPRCVDQHLVVLRAKRCCTNLIHTIGHHKNLPTSEVTQRHEQSTKVIFRLSTRKGTRPLTITGVGYEQSPTHAEAPPLLQAISVVATTQRNKKNHNQHNSKCH
jgi:hypothetical protein